MYYFNGYVYGGRPKGILKVTAVRALANQMLLLTFNECEQRLFDASQLTGPVFLPLTDEQVFRNVQLDHGVVTWMDGEIDCAPEYMYEHSEEYAQVS